VRVYAVVSEQMSDETIELFVDRQMAEPRPSTQECGKGVAMPDDHGEAIGIIGALSDAGLLRTAALGIRETSSASGASGSSPRSATLVCLQRPLLARQRLALRLTRVGGHRWVTLSMPQKSCR
jgi:hypothetical protein